MALKKAIDQSEKEVVTVVNNDPRLVVLPPTKRSDAVTLRPGDNEVDAEYLAEVIERQDVADLFQPATSHDNTRPMLETVSRKANPLLPPEARDTLLVLPEEHAVSLVADADESLLQRWAGNEKRPRVMKAIRERLVDLSKV